MNTKVRIAGLMLFTGLILFSCEDPQLPVVVTYDVSDADASTATCTGEVIFDGGAPVTARGVCFSEEKNPDLSDKFTEDGEGVGKFTSVMRGLNTDKTYYYKAYATNKAGTAYGNQKEFQAVRLHDIPEIMFKGHKLYIYPTDNHPAIFWGGYGEETFAYSTDNGKENTAEILDKLRPFKTIAAKFCDELDSYGYDDWYLPAVEELSAMYDQKELIGNFIEKSYWSSTEYNNYNAVYVSFYDGYVGNTVKTYDMHLRCIRRDP